MNIKRFPLVSCHCKTLLTTLFVMMALTLGLTGCGGGTGAGSGDDDTLSIAVIPKGTAHVFWLSVHAGAKTAAEELGVEIEWQGPQTETQKSQQINIVNDFIVRQVDGICLAPQDQDAMVTVVEQVARADIPCVIFDSGVNTDQYLSFVATDNYEGGVKAAEEMGRLLEGEGTCMMVRTDPASDSTNQREAGFMDTLEEKFPNIEIVDQQYGYSDRDQSRSVAEDMLTANPEVDAVFGSNESSTFGALLALQALDLAGDKIFVGFDSSVELVNGLEAGEIDALVLQDPFNMGYTSVETVVKHLRGEEVTKEVNTGVYLVTPSNMNEPEMQRLLSPDLSILDQ